MLKDEADYGSYFEDTMKAGHYENDRQSVDIMIRSSQDVIRDLVGYGVEFQRGQDGAFAFTREGAHSDKRILFHEDVTGREITSKLLMQVRKRPHIELLEHTMVVDIVSQGNVCYGAVIRKADGSLEKVEADYTVLPLAALEGYTATPPTFAM